MIGKKIGKWIVLQHASKIGKNREIHFKCQCECGCIKIKRKSELLGPKNKQCKSCSVKETNLKIMATTRHGRYKTNTYHTWKNMKSRCNNPKNDSYIHYGGRGIQVCDRWNKFENFLEDMGERPEDREIDRINVDGNYEPENCRWVTKKENRNNRRK